MWRCARVRQVALLLRSAMFYGTAVWDPALIIAQVRLVGARHKRTWSSQWALLPDCGHTESLLHKPRLPVAPHAGCVPQALTSPIPGGGYDLFTLDDACLLLCSPQGSASPKLSLFYFFDYSAITGHSFMGWCARDLGDQPPVLLFLTAFSPGCACEQDGHNRAFGERRHRVRLVLSPAHAVCWTLCLTGTPPQGWVLVRRR